MKSLIEYVRARLAFFVVGAIIFALLSISIGAGFAARHYAKQADEARTQATIFKARGDDALEEVAKLKTKNAATSLRVMALEDAHERAKKLPPLPRLPAPSPVDLTQLASALVDSGLSVGLSVPATASASVLAPTDARRIFDWKENALRVPGLMDRIEADVRLQVVSDSLIAGLKTERGELKEIVARQDGVIDLRTKEAGARGQESIALRSEVKALRIGTKTKVVVSFTLGAAAGYGVGKLFKLF